MTQTHTVGAANGTAAPRSRSSTRTIYRSAIVHSLSLTELQVIPDALVCVGDDGAIEWVDDLDQSGADGRDGRERGRGRIWEDVVRERARERGVRGAVRAVWLKEGFMCPGLIDTHTVSWCIRVWSNRLKGSGECKYSYGGT